MAIQARASLLNSWVRKHSTESLLSLVLLGLVVFISRLSPNFFTISNAFDILNSSAIDLIFASGLIVVLISGGIDISFAVLASVVQYIVALLLQAVGGGNWLVGLVSAGMVGLSLGAINATLIHHFRIISIVVTIATFNLFFGALMFLTRGTSIYDLPDWWLDRIPFFAQELPDGSWSQLQFPVMVMVVCLTLTSLLLNRSNLGRQLYAFGCNPEGAKRVGIRPAFMQYFAFGWMGVMAGVAGLMQVHYTQEVVPNALYGRELDVLAAVVLGGARLGGGKGSVWGCVLGVLLLAISQNALNLLGFSPYAFRMVSGAIIIIAISLSNIELKTKMVRRVA